MSSPAPDEGSEPLLSAAKVSFLLLVALLPWMKHGLTIGGLEAFPTDFLFLVTAALWLAALITHETSLRLHPSFLLLAIYFAAMAVSAMLSVDRQVSAFKLLTQVYLLSLPVLAFNLVRSVADVRRLFAWWLVPAVAVGAYGVVTLLLFPFIGWHSFLREPLHNFGTLPAGPYPRIELTFEFPAMLANYLGVSLMFLLLARSFGWIGRRASVVGCAALLVSALFALTPGFGGLLAMLALWLCYRQRDRRPGLARTAIAIAFVLTALQMLIAAVTPVADATSPFLIHVPGLAAPLTPAVRLRTWMAAAHNFLGSPLFGRGIGVDAVSVIYRGPQDVAAFYVTDAHNFVLNIAAECGTLGVAALGALVWSVVRKARGAAKESNTLLFGLSIAWLSGFVLQGLVGSFEDARHLWVLFGLIAAVTRLESDVATSPPLAPRLPAQ